MCEKENMLITFLIFLVSIKHTMDGLVPKATMCNCFFFFGYMEETKMREKKTSVSEKTIPMQSANSKGDKLSMI